MVSDTSAVSVGEGRPAARCRKRMAAARSFNVLPAWPASRPAARKAATSPGEAGREGPRPGRTRCTRRAPRSGRRRGCFPISRGCDRRGRTRAPRPDCHRSPVFRPPPKCRTNAARRPARRPPARPPRQAPARRPVAALQPAPASFLTRPARRSRGALRDAAGTGAARGVFAPPPGTIWRAERRCSRKFYAREG